MTEDALLDRLSEFLDFGAKRRKKKADELEKLIHKIRKKEKNAIAEIRKADKGKKIKSLNKRYKILHAQRKKGEKILKGIKNQK